MSGSSSSAAGCSKSIPARCARAAIAARALGHRGARARPVERGALSGARCARASHYGARGAAATQKAAARKASRARRTVRARQPLQRDRSGRAKGCLGILRPEANSQQTEIEREIKKRFKK